MKRNYLAQYPRHQNGFDCICLRLVGPVQRNASMPPGSANSLIIKEKFKSGPLGTLNKLRNILIYSLTSPAKVDAFFNVNILKTTAHIIRQSRVIVLEKVAKILHDNVCVVICFDKPICVVSVVLPNVPQTCFSLSPKPVPTLFHSL